MRTVHIGVSGSRGRRRGAAPCRALRDRGDQGAAIVESAIAIPLLLVTGLIGSWCVGVGASAVRLSGAAGDAARAVARGESWSAVVSRVASVDPDATAHVASADGAAGSDAAVTVTVEREVHAPGPILGGLSFTVTRSATALVEDGIAP